MEANSKQRKVEPEKELCIWMIGMAVADYLSYAMHSKDPRNALEAMSWLFDDSHEAELDLTMCCDALGAEVDSIRAWADDLFHLEVEPHTVLDLILRNT
jgi:hypothetical protein